MLDFKAYSIQHNMINIATSLIPGLSARALGVVGLVFNYQMLYGTVVLAFSLR